MILRYVESLFLALLVTFGVFYVMQSLVMGSQRVERADASAVTVDFARRVAESETQTKDRRLPEKLPPKPPPAPPALSVAEISNRPSAAKIPKLPPQVTGGLKLAGGFEFSAAVSDTEALPLVRIEPRYPSRARAMGIQGWVTVRFTIGKTGTVSDAQVLAADPAKVFDTAALRAIENWKYKPRIIDGKPVPREGVEVTLRFELED